MIAKWLGMAAAATVVFTDVPCSAYSPDGFLYSNGAYTTTLDDTIPSAINDLGEMIGHYGDNNDDRAYLYDNGVYTIIQSPAGSSSHYYTGLTGLNASGAVIGYGYNGIQSAGFLYVNGQYTLLLYVPAEINDSGEIVGTTFNYQGYLYDNGAYTPIDVLGSTFTEVTGINNSGQIVGYSSATGAFLYESGVFTRLLPSYIGLTPMAINNSGQILLTSGYIDNSREIVPTDATSFLYTNGSYFQIDPPGSVFAFATGFNDSGEVVGSAEAADGVFYGFLYSDGIYQTIDVPGSTAAYGTYPTAINDLGQIVGTYNTPEPSTWAMMLLGFAGLSFVGYRQRQKLAGAAAV